MSIARRIIAGLLGVHFSARAALVLAVGALAVLLLPGAWAYVVAAAWAVAWVALVRDDIVKAGAADDLGVERRLPLKLSIGVPNAVEYVVSNRSARDLVLEARDTPPAEFRGERSLGTIALPPHGDVTLTLRFVPPARGSFRFGGVGVRTIGPRRLAGRRFDLELAAEAAVYPDISAVKSYALLARKGALAEIGIKATRLLGSGTEFESLRDYLPGDDFRAIDWKATARRGTPVTRLYEADRSQTMVLAIDAGRMMLPRVGDVSKLDRAINAALLLAYLGTRLGDLVGLLVFGRDIDVYLPPARGHRQFLAILDALHSVEGRSEEPDYEGALRYLATRLKKRSLVVVFTDLAGTEPSRRLLRVLAGMSPRHLPLVATQRNRDLERKATLAAATELDVFSAAVAETLLKDKESALKTLAARGSLVLDVDPAALSVASVNRYLEVKARGRL